MATIYTRFDRHRWMEEDTRHEIMSIIRELRLVDSDISELNAIENWLYGMFDGYLYTELAFAAGMYLPERLAERVMNVIRVVSGYPKED